MREVVSKHDNQIESMFRAFTNKKGNKPRDISRGYHSEQYQDGGGEIRRPSQRRDYPCLVMIRRHYLSFSEIS